MKTQAVKIGAIKPNPSNPRIIKDDKFHKLVKSIKEFPQMLELRPIVVNEDMVVLGGNMRLKACKEAGLQTIPVIRASELTPEQQKQFIIKDNVGFGEWDWDMLANEFDATELEDWGLDIPNFETLSEIEAKGRMAATLDEKLDTYLNATIKQIVLYFEMEEYEYVLRLLDKIAIDNDLPDNSSVIKHILQKYESK